MHLKSTFKNTSNQKHYNRPNSVALVGYIGNSLCLLLPSEALSLVASVNSVNCPMHEGLHCYYYQLRHGHVTTVVG